MRERVHLSGKTLFPGLQAAKAELSACTQVRVVAVQHRPSTTGQDSTAPGIWGVKEGQGKKLAFFSLVAAPLAGARRLQHVRLPMNTCWYLQRSFQINRSGT